MKLNLCIFSLQHVFVSAYCYNVHRARILQQWGGVSSVWYLFSIKTDIYRLPVHSGSHSQTRCRFYLDTFPIALPSYSPYRSTSLVSVPFALPNAAKRLFEADTRNERFNSHYFLRVPRFNLKLAHAWW